MAPGLCSSVMGPVPRNQGATGGEARRQGASAAADVHIHRAPHAGVDPTGGRAMAIAIRTSRHRRAPRPPWMRRRAHEHDTLLAAFMVALIIASITILVRSAPGV